MTCALMVSDLVQFLSGHLWPLALEKRMIFPIKAFSVSVYTILRRDGDPTDLINVCCVFLAVNLYKIR